MVMRYNGQTERRSSLMFASALAITMLGGCGNGTLDDGGKSATTDDTTGELDVDAEPSRVDAPVLLEASVYTNNQGQCFLEASYSDPQGPQDVRRGTVWAVEPSTGTELWIDDLLVCESYSCVGSFSASHSEYASAPCTQLASFELHALVYDRSGLDSNVVVLEQQ